MGKRAEPGLDYRYTGVDGLFYVDGHVRVYHGSQTSLPKHYIARQKLCLRATTDYWVNAMDGQPFFMVNKAVDPGLLHVMETEIIPELEKSIPLPPDTPDTPETTDTTETEAPRFTLVFDREGYSPDFFLRMKKKNIACLTYHKHPGEKWPEGEFQMQRVKLVSGHVVDMRLAERGSFIGKKIWVREIRKLSESGHQTSVISTNYRGDFPQIAVAMFARWTQENFFKYMREHFNLDRLTDYSTDDIPDTVKVVNPEYRSLESQRRSKTALLSRRRAEFGKIIMKEEIEPSKVEKYSYRKAELREIIQELEESIERTKAELKAIKRHITVAELPEDQRFRQLGAKRKQLLDVIKMISYRAETSMVNIISERMKHSDEARSLLRAIYRNDVDLIPDKDAGILTVRLHHLANNCSSETLQSLCEELNETETLFPGTNLRLCYELVSV